MSWLSDGIQQLGNNIGAGFGAVNNNASQAQGAMSNNLNQFNNSPISPNNTFNSFKNNINDDTSKIQNEITPLTPSNFGNGWADIQHAAPALAWQTGVKNPTDASTMLMKSLANNTGGL